MCGHHVHAWCLQRTEEGVKTATGGFDGCEPPCNVGVVNGTLGPLARVASALNHEPSIRLLAHRYRRSIKGQIARFYVLQTFTFLMQLSSVEARKQSDHTRAMFIHVKHGVWLIHTKV